MLSLDVSLDALRHFVEYLYTDRLDGDLAVPLTAELMRLARERWREAWGEGGAVARGGGEGGEEMPRCWGRGP